MKSKFIEQIEEDLDKFDPEWWKIAKKLVKK